MARIFLNFTNLILRQNPKNRNLHIRNIGNSVNGEKELGENKGLINLSDCSDKDQNFGKIVKEVSKFIRCRPRWEQTLEAEFSGVNFSDPSLVIEILKDQGNLVLMVRFFYWVSSRFGGVTDEGLCGVVFKVLVVSNAANAAKDFLEFTKFNPEPSCLELYVRCLCKNGLVEDALGVFDQLKRVGWCPALSTWKSALFGAVGVHKADVVWKLYGDMVDSGVTAMDDGVMILHLVKAFCIKKNASKGFEFLRQILKNGYVPSIVAFNELVYWLSKEGNFHEVSSVLHIMILKGCTPNIYTYQGIILWLCKRRMVSAAFRIFNELKDRGYDPDDVMYTTMIRGLCKENLLDYALKLLLEMIQKGGIPDEYTYQALISRYIKTGNTVGAKKLCKVICDTGFERQKPLS